MQRQSEKDTDQRGEGSLQQVETGKFRPTGSIDSKEILRPASYNSCKPRQNAKWGSQERGCKQQGFRRRETSKAASWAQLHSCRWPLLEIRLPVQTHAEPPAALAVESNSTHFSSSQSPVREELAAHPLSTRNHLSTINDVQLRQGPPLSHDRSSGYFGR